MAKATKKTTAKKTTKKPAKKVAKKTARKKKADMTPAEKAWYGVTKKERSARAARAWKTRRANAKAA